MPRFSVVIPAYNAEDTLAETLDAVLAQRFADWECVVVDDGSVDGTAAIAASYADRDPRIRTVSQSNLGSAGAYNTGVSETRGDFVVMCSADDILLPDHLAEMSDFIEAEPGYDIYSTNGYFWRPDGSRHLHHPSGTRDEVVSLTLADVIRVCFFSVGATYRRRLFDEVGGYRLGVFGEDYDFWLRAMAQGARHRYLPMALSLHRVSSTQKSADLETAYRSDIRLVTDLRRSAHLTPEEDRAVEACVAERERRIAALHQRPRRRVLVRVGVRLLGEERLHRLVVRVKSLWSGRTRGDGEVSDGPR